MLHVRTNPAAALLAGAFALGACGGGGGGSDAPTSPGGGGTTTVASVSVNGNVTSLTVGQSVTFTATPRDANGATLSNAVTWTSSNSSVLSVVATSGVATGVAPGVATLAASVGSITGTRAVTVDPAGGGGGTFPQNATVTMPETVFVPSQVDILVNGRVDYVFTALAHDVIFSGTGAPQNIPVTTNATVSRTFNVRGTFSMVCTLHAGMNGTVIVH